MFNKSHNSSRNSKIVSLVLCLLLSLLLLLTVSLPPAMAQETDNPTAVETEVQEPTAETTAVVIPPPDSGGVVVVIEAPEPTPVDDFEHTSRGDTAYLIVALSVAGALLVAVITGLQQRNLSVKLTEALTGIIGDAKTAEALERQFMRLDPVAKQTILQLIAVADPGTAFLPGDLPEYVVEWLKNITDGNLDTGPYTPPSSQAARRGTDSGVPPVIPTARG